MTAALAPIPTTLRAMGPDDFAFCWETSLKVRKPYAVPWGAWVAAVGDRQRALLEMPGADVRVLEAEGVIVGFAHLVGEVLHMLYVKRDLRGLGFGLQLVGSHSVPILVASPNACWRRWAYGSGLRWKVAT